MLYPLA